VGLIGAALRFVVAAVVLMLIGYVVPGFSHLTFWEALLAALVVAAAGYIIESLFGRKVSPYNRGLVGFVVAAVVIYLAQFVVPGLHVTVLGALLASLVIGLVDLVIPTAIR
jgi:putative membrane protein